MPDICDLILEQHHEFRVRFTELDAMRDADEDALDAAWRPLADLLEVHAEAEEQLFYPRLIEHGVDPMEETEDAITDHNSITEAVERAAGLTAGSSEWWDAVDEARKQNSSHTAEEERGALADFRRNAPQEVREEIGAAWLAFHRDHGRVDRDEKDFVEYVAAHGDEEDVAAAESFVEDDD